jgi:EmrB/QacA subfamily drug resistance transporter
VIPAAPQGWNIKLSVRTSTLRSALVLRAVPRCCPDTATVNPEETPVNPEVTLDSSSSPTPPTAGPDPKRWIALVVIAIAQLMVVLDASIVNIALPQAQKDLGISDVDRQWVITAYTLAFGGLLLLGGRIADFVGRKRVFIIGLIGFAGASALGGIAQNAELLFAARALQGAFAALLAPAALSLISVTFTASHERARAFAVYGAISGGGAAIGLILGGVLTEYASWRWCLLVNVPIAAIAAFAATRFVTESKAHGNTKYDLPGAFLVTAGLVSLVYGFTEAAKEGVGWGATSTIGFLVAAVVLLVLFVVVELRTDHPLLPMRVILDRNRGGSYLASLLVGAGLFSMFLFLTYYFQVNLGYSPLKSGFAFLPFSAGIIVTAGVVSNILPRTGPKPLMVAGAISATVGLLLFTLISDTSSWLTHVLPGELLMSIGLGLVFVPLSNLALIGVEEHDAGVASAVLNTSQQIGGSLGTALLSTFYASTVSGYLADNVKSPADVPRLSLLAAIEGYHVAFYIGAGLLALGAVTIIVLINAKRDDLPAEAAVGAH